MKFNWKILRSEPKLISNNFVIYYNSPGLKHCAKKRPIYQSSSVNARMWHTRDISQLVRA